MQSFKPDGYNSVSAYFVVDGAQRLIDFLQQVFYGVEKRRYDKPDGSIMHAEIQVDDSIIMVADASEQYPANTHLMHVYVSDVDATFSKAIAFGCEVVEAPKEQDGDPDRRGMFKDFADNMWAIGTQK
jgi:uncharacterized glyoxalase superfamily protein PhnB